jgi:hypothetical protein
MDITYLSDGALRIKGKNATLVINPTKNMPKTPAEGVIKLWDYPEFSVDKIEDQRIVIDGPGEYEVGGVKISASKVESKVVGKIDIDNVKILAGSGVSVEKIAEKAEGGGVIVVSADSPFNHDSLASMEPSVLIVYGDKSEEVAKSLGKTEITRVNKFSAAADKLPEEMQFVMLG